MDDTAFSPSNNTVGYSNSQSLKEEAWHREMRRRSNDVIRVSNPTNEDFVVQWDYNYHRIPANSTADVPRYIATKYCRDMKDKIINDQNQKKHDEELKERRKSGFPDFKNKYEENQETYERQDYVRTNNYTVSAEIYDKLWVGVVYEFGKDLPPRKDPRSGEVDITPDEIKILQNLDKKRVSDIPSAIQTDDKPFTAKRSKATVDEVSA